MVAVWQLSAGMRHCKFAGWLCTGPSLFVHVILFAIVYLAQDLIPEIERRLFLLIIHTRITKNCEKAS